jgi:hypothetical protein
MQGQIRNNRDVQPPPPFSFARAGMRDELKFPFNQPRHAIRARPGPKAPLSAALFFCAGWYEGRAEIPFQSPPPCNSGQTRPKSASARLNVPRVWPHSHNISKSQRAGLEGAFILQTIWCKPPTGMCLACHRRCPHMRRPE